MPSVTNILQAAALIGCAVVLMVTLVDPDAGSRRPRITSDDLEAAGRDRSLPLVLEAGSDRADTLRR